MLVKATSKNYLCLNFFIMNDLIMHLFRCNCIEESLKEKDSDGLESVLTYTVNVRYQI